ncbi:MAG: hypothetical protein ACKO0Z_00040 [Betaproteobacteria bacterium]
MRLLFLCASGLALAGCVSSSKPLKDASGQIVECKAAGWGWLGAPVAMISQADCVRDMKRKGFVPLDQDPNETVLPKGAVNYRSNVNIALPAGWMEQTPTSLQKAQGVRVYATNATIDAGLFVSSIKRSAITDVSRYIESRRASAKSGGQGGEVSPAELTSILGKEAYRFQSKNRVSNLQLRYAYTLIIGKDEIAMVTAWANDGNFDNVKDEIAGLADRLTGL